MSGFVDRIAPHLMNQSKPLPSANILIAFRNTIRVSADILIASADTLIVVKKKKRKAGIHGVALLLRVIFYCDNVTKKLFLW